MLLDQHTWLADNVLVKADRGGMLASLEIRTPYLHRAVAEFAASIPARFTCAGAGRGCSVRCSPGASPTSAIDGRRSRSARQSERGFGDRWLPPCGSNSPRGALRRGVVLATSDLSDRLGASRRGSRSLAHPVARADSGALARRPPQRPTRVLKTLIVTPDFPPGLGGIQTLVHRLARHVRELEIRVVTLDALGAARFDREQPFAVLRVPRGVDDAASRSRR